MPNPYDSLCDDFSIYMYLLTQSALPNQRETVLHFFESIQKLFPTMCHFQAREQTDFVLEEDREQGPYRWVGLESKRIGAGYINPPTLEVADQLHERILDLAPAHLNVIGLDCEALDVVFVFDFVYRGNHDEVVAEALGFYNAFEGFLTQPKARVIGCEPVLMLALEDDLRLQCRLSVETRTSAYQVRTGQYGEEPISVYFTVRQYWDGRSKTSFVDSYRKQRSVCQEMVDNYIVPSVIRPLARVIEAKQ
ncbi:MAG: hypothetical protein NZM31_10155 [Gemmatales bacterium]|nr:hypothetical protein [Gemmatales bacterium]MDW8387358.1 hypothetical protein [Gemmatales bacterium]